MEKTLTKYIIEALSQEEKDAIKSLKDLLQKIESGEEKVDIKNLKAARNKIKYGGRLGFQNGTKEETEDILYDRDKISTSKRTPGKILHHQGESTGRTRTVIKNTYDNDDFQIGERRLNHIDVEQNKAKQIAQIFMDNDDMDIYCDYLVNPSFTVEDLISHNKNHGNIFDILKKTGISINTLKELFQLTETKDSTTQGKGEILIKTLIDKLEKDNSDKNCKGHGDVHVDGVAIEVKGNAARCGGQKDYISSKNIDNRFKEIVNELNIKDISTDDIFSSEGRINKMLASLHEAGQTDEEILSIIEDCISSQYLKSKYNYKYDYSFLNVNEIIKNGKCIKESGENMITRLLMATQLYCYHQVEGFDYFLLFNTNINGGDFICIPAEDMTIEKLFYNNHIKIENGTGGAKGEKREQFVNINFK